MTVLDIKDTALIIIDIQEKLLNAVYNKEILQKKCEILSKAANILDLPIIITEQYPKGLGNTVIEIKNNLKDGNFNIYEKTFFNALYDENVLNNLKKLNKKNIIVCGIETHICVYQTALALSKNYNVVLIKDICGSRAEAEHLSALDGLAREGIKIETLEMVLFELLKTSKHPNFKEIQNLIK